MIYVKAMRRGLTVALAALVVLALTIPEAEARGGGGHRGGGSHRSYHKARTTHVHIHVPRAAKSKSASAKSSARANQARGTVGGPPPIDCARPNLTVDEIAFCQASPQSGGVGKSPAGR
ncbi:exported hypothetical protein [Magnetospirillum molischianum DSM 120]|uniref:Secreted protein n=2 Tax=Magnetospirillum molischianum TaxID=1083 RepID=H8FUX1_MAGML|nr:exported hypothetical protein [Magnetospirillum molischianum DSM 120]